MSETGQGLSIRAQKVRGIFNEFDSNRDGCLNRDEMAALVIAVNPRVKFSKDQIEAILDEVFRTYGEFIEGQKGLSFEGLLRTYDDGAGDVDRDFDALGLHLASASIAGDGNEELQTAETKINSRVDLGGSGSRLPTPSIADEASGNVVKRSSIVGAWARSPNHGITYDETWGFIEELELRLKEYEAKQQQKQRDEKKGGGGLNGVDTAAAAADWEDGVDKGEGFDRRRREDELGSESAAFKKRLAEFREKAGKVQTPEQAFDRHMAMGRCLLEHHWYEEAIKSFDLAERLKPQDVRAPFLMGNAYYSLGKYVDAEKKYRVALEAGEANSVQWKDLLPQVHVNLGIALEGEGMLIGACYHYREAAILNAKHYRALKLLGSALYGLGEYRAAEQCLVEALVLKPDYADAHCDLGSALHAQADDDKAIQEFQKAIDLNPNHHDALYNLGGLLKDSGRYGDAAEMYAKVLALKPGEWRAQLNRAVSLLGAGDYEEARKAFKEAFKMTNRVELYDAIKHLKQMQKRPKDLTSAIASAEQSATGRRSSIGDVDSLFVIVENARFRPAPQSNTTAREFLACALNIRKFQKHTRLYRCDVDDLRREIEKKYFLGSSRSTAIPNDNKVEKKELEKSLHQLLGFLTPDTFQGAMRAINEKIIAVLDPTGSAVRVDAGMFFAVLAPLCAGSTEKRKRLVFDILKWHAPSGREGIIPNTDAKNYIKYLRAIYLPDQGTSELAEVHGDEDKVQVSYPEFLIMFDDTNWGFGILNTLVKLETGDRVRHTGITCVTCNYVIMGPRFKEITKNFSLCPTCYSEGKVPADVKLEEYVFKEYSNEADIMDRFKMFRSKKGLTAVPAQPVT